MANNGIVNSLTFTGAVQGSATIQAQSVAGSLTFLLPNQVPTALQILTAQSINGNVVTFGWSAPQSAPSFSSITGSLALAQIAQGGASLNDVIQWNGTAWAASASAPGSGTVTTFSAGTLAPIFTTSVATATSTPALSFILTNAAQNAVLAGPSVGGAGAPSYRALVAADIPSLASLYDALGAAATAQTAAETFATAADVTVLSSAETFATTAAGTAQSNAETFATSADTVVLSTAEAYVKTIGPTPSQWVNSYTASTGVFTLSQPASTDLSDVALLAYLASPAFSGTPTAPTAAPLTSTTQIATTAFTTLAVGVETTRAEAAESANATAISAETTRAEAAEATKPVLSDGAGNPPSSGDNHIASGTGAITAGGNVTLSLSGAAAFTDTNYVVQVTRTNAVTGIGQLYAVPISGTQFSVSSSDNTDTTSTFAWTAIGY